MWSKMLRSEKNREPQEERFFEKSDQKTWKKHFKKPEQTTRKHLKEHKRGERLFLIAFDA